MVITSIKINKIENPTGPLIGVAAVTLDNMFTIQHIKIVEAKNGMLLVMPHQKNGDVVHPIDSRTRGVFEKLIFSAYSECVVQDWSVLKLSLRDEYLNTDFQKLSYEFYEIEYTMKFVPEKSELVVV